MKKKKEQVWRVTLKLSPVDVTAVDEKEAFGKARDIFESDAFTQMMAGLSIDGAEVGLLKDWGKGWEKGVEYHEEVH